MKYYITSGNKLNSVFFEKDASALLLNISSSSHGTLTIELPRNIIDSERQGTNHDENYAAYTDGQYTTSKKAIGFDKGSFQIEIAGTHQNSEHLSQQKYSR